MKLLLYTLWRSGTHWLSNMLTEIYAKEWIYSIKKGDDYNKETKLMIKQTEDKIIVRHISMTPSELIHYLQKYRYKIIFLLRDPRDVIVSTVYMRKYVEAFRKNLPPFPVMEFNEILWWELGHYHKTYTKLINDWYNFHSNIKINVKYEELKKNTFEVLKKISKFIGILKSDNEIKEIVENHKFKKITGRKEGETDVKSHYRRGVIGGWKEDLTKHQANLINLILFDSLISLDYIPEINFKIKNNEKKIFKSVIKNSDFHTLHQFNKLVFFVNNQDELNKGWLKILPLKHFENYKNKEMIPISKNKYKKVIISLSDLGIVQDKVFGIYYVNK